MNKAVLYGQIGLNGQNVPKLVEVESKEETGNVFYQRKNQDCFVLVLKKRKENVISTTALFGLIGQNGPLAQKLVTVE